MLRLQKLLADAGIASRRKAEQIILDGRVTVDGRKVTQLGEKADPEKNKILIDGKPLPMQEKVYILLNKPGDTITSTIDPHARDTVMSLVSDIKEKLKPVGRLDVDTEGLLLLTNDGELAHRLSHPRWGVEKVYHAEVQGRPNSAVLKQLREGIALEEGVTAPAKVKSLPQLRGRAILEITIHTGWNRQVRRMLQAVEHPVVSLKRVAYGPLQLGNLPRGKWRRLNPVEVNKLKKAVGLTTASK